MYSVSGPGYCPRARPGLLRLLDSVLIRRLPSPAPPFMARSKREKTHVQEDQTRLQAYCGVRDRGLDHPRSRILRLVQCQPSFGTRRRRVQSAPAGGRLPARGREKHGVHPRRAAHPAQPRLESRGPRPSVRQHRGRPHRVPGRLGGVRGAAESRRGNPAFGRVPAGRRSLGQGEQRIPAPGQGAGSHGDHQPRGPVAGA